MFSNLSIRYKLTLLTALFVGVTSIVVGLYVVRLSSQSAKQGLTDQALTQAKLYQHVLLDPFRLGDDYQVYELIAAPYHARQLQGQADAPSQDESYLEETLLLDDAGAVLATSDPMRFPLATHYLDAEPAFIDLVPQLPKIKSSSAPILWSAEHENHLFVAVPLGENGVKHANLILDYSMENLMIAANHRNIKLGLMIGLITLLTMLLAWWAAYRFTLPILRLSRSMRDMAARHGISLSFKATHTRNEVVQLDEIFTQVDREMSTLLDGISKSTQRLKIALDGSQISVWEIDLRTNEVWLDASWAMLLGHPAAVETHTTSTELLSLVHPADLQNVMAAAMQTRKGEIESYIVEHRVKTAQGEWLWILSRGRVIEHDANGHPTRVSGTNTSINQHKFAEAALQYSEQRFRDVSDASGEYVWEIDANLVYTYVSRQSTAVKGYSPEELIGHTPIEFMPVEDIQSVSEIVNHAIANKTAFKLQHRDITHSGNVLWEEVNGIPFLDDKGEVIGLRGTGMNITERRLAEEEIHNLAFYDSLTQLPNRRLFIDRIGLALSISVRSQLYGALLFLDMDRFKILNDTLGHDYGDLLLVEVAKRIQSCVREIDTVARLGGDEFVILLEEVDEHAEEASRKVAVIAEKIRSCLTATYQLKDSEYHSSPSIGVSLYRGKEESAEALLKHADMAMYQAKDSGRNAVRFFSQAMQLAVETHAALEADLRHAVPEQQLHLHYQIQVDNDGHALGAEALVRWIHPTRGMVSPAQFIPIAEETSLILDIGNWVLDTACRQLSVWKQREMTRKLTIAVNVSAQQFKQHDFVANIATALRIHNIEAAQLKLELTESVVLNDVKDVVAKMHALKALGVGLSMDDFGTGYSSLSYLKQLPLDQIKIDQSFVRDITTDPNDAVMVQTIIDLAKNFRLNVIAEGVETEEQRAFLAQHGCMAYQGYFFSKPVPIEQFEVILEQGFQCFDIEKNSVLLQMRR